MRQLPGGIWPVMLTPFSEDGTIDFGGLKALTEFYIASGAAGLFTNCLSGEMYRLEPEERLSLTEAVVRFTADCVPVVATGTFSRDLDENAEFISRVYEKGVAAVVVNSNQLCGASDGEDLFGTRLEELLEATGKIPLGIYECPLPYKRLLSTDLLARMVATGRFSYFKDTSCDNELIRARLAATRDTGFVLFNAHTPTGLDSLRDGAAGLSPIGANFYPELYSFLYRHANKEESEAFLKVSRFLSLNDSLVHTFYPFSAKWFLQRRGLPISTSTRTLVPKANPDALNKLRELQSGVEELLASIN